MEDIEETKRLAKIKDLLKYYQKSGQEIVLENKNNKKLEIKGIIDELKTIAFLGFRPYVIISGMKIFLEDINETEIYPSDVKIKEENSSSERKGIPKSLKFAVWERYFGNKLRGKCLCCGVQEITRDDCEMCHIISVAEGGETNVNNLKPGCKDCNRSMGTMNFDDYKAKYH